MDSNGTENKKVQTDSSENSSPKVNEEMDEELLRRLCVNNKENSEYPLLFDSEEKETPHKEKHSIFKTLFGSGRDRKEKYGDDPLNDAVSFPDPEPEEKNADDDIMSQIRQVFAESPEKAVSGNTEDEKFSDGLRAIAKNVSSDAKEPEETPAVKANEVFSSEKVGRSEEEAEEASVSADGESSTQSEDTAELLKRIFGAPVKEKRPPAAEAEEIEETEEAVETVKAEDEEAVETVEAEEAVETVEAEAEEAVETVEAAEAVETVEAEDEEAVETVEAEEAEETVETVEAEAEEAVETVEAEAEEAVETVEAEAEEAVETEEDEEGSAPDESAINDALAAIFGEEAVKASGITEEEPAKDAYIAADDVFTAGTKEYSGSFEDLEKTLSSISPDDTVSVPPVISDEVEVAEAINPYTDNAETDETEEPKKKKYIMPEEYTSREQYDEFAENLRTKSFRALCSAFWAFCVFLALLYLESAGFTDIYHPELLRPDGAFRTIYLLIDIQLVFIAALITLSDISDGARSLFSGKPTRNSLYFTVALLSVIEAALFIFFGTGKVMLFGSVAAMFAFMSCVARSLEVKRTYRSLRVFASSKTKLIASELGKDSAEYESLGDRVSGDASVYSIEKADFITGFFAKANERSSFDKAYGILILVSVVLSAAYAAYSSWKGSDISGTVGNFFLMAFMTLPACGMFTSVIPSSHFAKKLLRKESAIAGIASAERIADSGIISFTDKEIFPAQKVKLTTIRTYGTMRIDSAIMYAAMIFKKLGGPLSDVFRRTVSASYDEIKEDFDFLEITADGICARINEKEVYVGNKAYMKFYDFDCDFQKSDASYEEKGGRIMYMVIGSEFCAKFFIKYPISKKFEKVLFDLCQSGVSAVVKTCDPNIDTELLRSSVSGRINCAVIKTSDAMKDAPVAESADSGVVCNSTISNMLLAIGSCSKLLGRIRFNLAMKIVSVAAGAALAIFFLIAGKVSSATTLFVLLYDLLWLIPTLFSSSAD